MTVRDFKLLAFVGFGVFVAATQTGTSPWLAFVVACALYVVLSKGLLVLVAWRGFVRQSGNDIRFETLGEQALTAELIAHRERAAALGFAPDGPPLRFISGGEALVVPMLHRDGKVKLTLSSAAKTPAHVRCSVVSRFPEVAGWIATQSERSSAYMLATPGALKQCFPGATMEMLVEHHARALAFVAREGMTVSTIPAGEFQDIELWFGRRLHAALRAHPWRYASVFVLRRALNASPHLRPLADQPGARRELARIRAGETAALPPARMI